MRYSEHNPTPVNGSKPADSRPYKGTPANYAASKYAPPEPPPPDESYWTALLREGEIRTASAEAENQLVPERQKSAESDWDLAEQAETADEILDLTISGANRGGLLIEWHTLHGFVPASQLLDTPTTGDSQERRVKLAERVGQTLKLRIIELDRAQNRLIFSERAAQVQAGTRATILDQLQRGDSITGRVTNVCDFGTFVDLGGLEGLIHISEMSWGRVGHPADLVRPGDTVRVHVMDVDRVQARVALSLKRMLPDPWASVDQHYTVGQIVIGRVTNIVEFGAFVSLEEGLEGLIHISELAEGTFMHPRNVLHEGELIQARVLNIDSQGRRLGLSLRTRLDSPED